MVWLSRNEQQTYRFNFRPQKWPSGLTLAMTLTSSIFKVKCDLDPWPYAWCWPRIFMVKFWNSCISGWEGRLTLNKGGGSRLFMTMPKTMWWLRSGVRIYHIVTGVTSDVGVPSTGLVIYLFLSLNTQKSLSAVVCLLWISGQNWSYYNERLVYQAVSETTWALIHYCYSIFMLKYFLSMNETKNPQHLDCELFSVSNSLASYNACYIFRTQ